LKIPKKSRLQAGDPFISAENEAKQKIIMEIDMYKVEEIFRILSQEKKELRPEYAYKTAEEGLLRAMYFFRWCNKKELDNTDRIVEAFAKKKIPEQQVEHFGSALIMIDHYETEPLVKDAIREIEEKVREKTGKSTLEQVESQKIERRTYKNVYLTFAESIENLKKRVINLRKTFINSWVIVAVLLVINVVLSITTVYQRFLNNYLPGVIAGNPMLEQTGGNILAFFLFLFPSFLILFFNRHKMAEYSERGKKYPEEIRKMEETLDSFRSTLEEKNITP
jgi:hypothetical protein